MSVYLVFQKGQVGHEAFTSDHLDWWVTAMDRSRYRTLRTDPDGRLTFPTLIPNASYLLRLRDEPMVAGNQKEKEVEFRVESGLTHDLGQITLKRTR